MAHWKFAVGDAAGQRLISSTCIPEVAVVYLGCKPLIKGMYFVWCLCDDLHNGTQILSVGFRKTV